MTDLLRANSVNIPLRDECVDLIVTSPPYFALRSYQDGGEHYDGQIGSEESPAAFLAALWAVTDECWRVLKPSGSLFVNLGDKYAGSGGHNNSNLTRLHGNHGRESRRDLASSRNAPDRYNQAADVRAKSRMLLPHRYALGCVDPDYRAFVERSDRSGPQWICRMDMVWSKPNGLPESVTDRVRASHEYWFHLTRSERYYANVDQVREAQRSLGRAEGRPNGRSAAETLEGGRNHLAHLDEWHPNPLGKLPGSVWSIPSEPLTVPDWLGVDHYAAFPTEWPRRLILGWSPPGICTACGEGRRAEVDKTEIRRAERSGTSVALAAEASAQGRTRFAADVRWMGEQQTTITGERCACPTPTAPTRPAIVLDPFGGTGTTAMIARALGRHGINIDLSADYLRLARWRIHDSGHWDKAVERTTGRRCETPTQLPGQMSLL